MSSIFTPFRRGYGFADSSDNRLCYIYVHRSGEAERDVTKSCYQLAVFREPNTASVRTLINCAGGHRVSHAYLSESNTVDVEFLVSRNQLKNQLFFLLKFTGTVSAMNSSCVYASSN